jgi:hypothetical protein
MFFLNSRSFYSLAHSHYCSLSLMVLSTSSGGPFLFRAIAKWDTITGSRLDRYARPASPQCISYR